jgi:hypothetical protein
VFIGGSSGFDHTDGGNNVFLGHNAGQQDETGFNNTYLGSQAGMYSVQDGNVFIGYQAGYSEHNSDRLIIANSSSKNLVYGDFLNEYVRINNKLGVNISSNPTYNFEVNGTSRIGTAGSQINAIIRSTYSSSSFGSLSADASYPFTIYVPGVVAGASVMVSPRDQLPAGIVIAYSRVYSSDYVEITLQNTRGVASGTIAANQWYVTVVQ